MGVATAASAAASVGDPEEVVVRGGRVVVRQKGQRRGWRQRSARRVVVAAAVFHPPHQAHPCSSRSRYLGARGSPFHGSRAARRQKHADAAVIDTSNTTTLRSLAQLLLIIRTRGRLLGRLRSGGAAGADANRGRLGRRTRRAKRRELRCVLSSPDRRLQSTDSNRD
jgi:hypothetical protein